MRSIKNVKFLSEIKKKRALSTKIFRFSLSHLLESVYGRLSFRQKFENL